MGQSFNADILDGTGEVRLNGQVQYTGTNAASPAALNATSPVGTITSGNLPQVGTTWSSGTAQQASTARDVELYLQVTGDATNNIASCAVALSPDNTTFTTVGTISLAAAVNNTGAIAVLSTVRVPAGWYLKLTFSHAAVSQSYYA
jgi:hypothetical protein